MNILEQIMDYTPFNEQEEKDKDIMIDFLKRGENVFSRQNQMAHFTASAWVVDRDRQKVLMVFHNIYQSWSWTGGHADGEEDLLSVALKEVSEETGIAEVVPVSDDIFSLEILTVNGHIKHGEYVPSHLHFNITFLLEADVFQKLKSKPDENSGVCWVEILKAPEKSDEPWIRDIYRKLNQKLDKKFNFTGSLTID